MRKFFLLCMLGLSILIAGEDKPTPPQGELRAAAESAYSVGDYVKSADLFDQLVKIYGVGRNDGYNAACASALAGRKDRALELLDQVVDNGYRNQAHMSKDSDLNSLHASPQWAELTARVIKNQKTYEARFDPQLRATLQRIYDADQKPRRAIGKLTKEHGRKSEIVKKDGKPNFKALMRKTWPRLRH